MANEEIQAQPQEPLVRFEETAQTRTLRDRVTAAVDGYKDWAEVHPFAATTAETIAIFAARQLGRRLAKRVGVDTGNALTEQHVATATEHPVRAALEGIVAAPIVEELVFRAGLEYPARRAEASGHRQAARAIRLVTTLGFAAGHAGLIRPAKEWPRAPYAQVGVKDATLPAEQLIGGLNYSRLNRTRGLKHAVAAHALNNALYAATAAPEIIRRRQAR